MALYDFRYRLQSAPEPKTDGTGTMQLDMWVVARPSGTNDDFAPAGPHLYVVLSAADVKVVNDMPDGTADQKTAKRRAFKNLIRAFLRNGTLAPLDPDWDQEALQLFMDNNDSSKLEVDRINTFITVTLNKTYPWDVAINV